MENMLVKCATCGKLINPLSAYYLARRSNTLARVGEWEYFGVGPVLYGCSFRHYEAALASLWVDERERTTNALSVMPEAPDHKE